MKILVVDDEALLLKGIRVNLQNEGYEVITGSNGEEAVKLASDPDVSLVILDVMMPVMDGLEACMRIREFSDVPIIMLTAKTDDMDKLMGFEHGADDYITKPCPDQNTGYFFHFISLLSQTNFQNRILLIRQWISKHRILSK